ncbi:hypothetical protein KCU73_g2818, partial [Aureobasidium melanogenum]
MVKLSQLFWAISVATGAGADRFGNSLHLHKFDEEKGQIDLTVTSEDGALSTSTMLMQSGKPTVWQMKESALLSFKGEVYEYSFINTTIVLAAPDAKLSKTRPFDRGVSGEWFTTDDKTFTAPKLTVAEFNFTE